MERQQVITILESLANGADPAAFQNPDSVLALLAASEMLKQNEEGARVTKSKFTAAGTPWSAEEDARLAAEFDGGMTIAQIALQHQRSSGGITARLVKLGRIDPAKVKSRERGVRLAS
jgi:hypothetical protein